MPHRLLRPSLLAVLRPMKPVQTDQHGSTDFPDLSGKLNRLSGKSLRVIRYVDELLVITD
jgi:hypothetical protein